MRRSGACPGVTPAVWLAGSGGRTPFVGHFRGGREAAGVQLAWAGRLAGSAGPLDGWEAAEAARDALAETTMEGGPEETLAVAVARLASLDPRWLARGDLCVLLAAAWGDRAWLAGAGLTAVWEGGPGGWRPLVPDGHPLLGDPGLPTASYAFPRAARWLGVPIGAPTPWGEIAAACGVRT